MLRAGTSQSTSSAEAFLMGPDGPILHPAPCTLAVMESPWTGPHKSKAEGPLSCGPKRLGLEVVIKAFDSTPQLPCVHQLV